MNKKFKCNWKECLYITIRKADLARHVISKHTNEKKFSCDCGKTYKHSHQLLKHKRLHITSKFKCDYLNCMRIKCDIHQKNKHPLGPIYYTIIARTENPKHCGYRNYGGRGIKMCKRWRDNFWNFIEDVTPRPKDHVLDRIDPDGNYEPNNCRWVTHKENMHNTRLSLKNRDKYEIINISVLPPAFLRKLREYQKKDKNKEIKTIQGQLSIIGD